MDVADIVQKVAIAAIPVLFAITLHEAAHGFVAKRFGDLTAYAQGRVSLNPLRHIDPMGTVIVPLVLFVLTRLAGSGILFGWAKPVPVNFSALRHPKRDMLWVAAAGRGPTSRWPCSGRSCCAWAPRGAATSHSPCS